MSTLSVPPHKKTLLEISRLWKAYPAPGGGEAVIVKDFNLKLIGSSRGDCAPRPSHTTGHADPHPAVEACTPYRVRSDGIRN